MRKIILHQRAYYVLMVSCLINLTNNTITLEIVSAIRDKAGILFSFMKCSALEIVVVAMSFFMENE
jgi:hypothetical protein